MPHDQEGRLIEVGDVISAIPYNHPPNHPNKNLCGLVIEIRADEQNCTGQCLFMYDNTSKKEGEVFQDYFGAEDAHVISKLKDHLDHTIRFQT